jgi:hypothetical protein
VTTLQENMLHHTPVLWHVNCTNNIGENHVVMWIENRSHNRLGEQ